MFINLDANASSSLLPEVSASLSEYLSGPLNPSSVHRLGQRARGLVEDARAEVRLLLELSSHDRVVFTSGATEANNAAILSPFLLKGAVSQCAQSGASLVTSSVEHQSVLAPAALVEEWGASVARIPVSSQGELDEAALLTALGPDTKLVSLMLANNETGHIFSLQNLTQAIRERAPHALLHSDGVQLVGKAPVSFPELGVDLLTISGHKLGALGGVGALIVRDGTETQAFLRGGSQEGYLRAGTENVLGVISLGIAAKVIRSTLRARTDRMKAAATLLRERLTRELPQLKWNTPLEGALPNTLSITIPGVPADDLVVALDLEGVCISSGAACSSGKPLPSHVLKAMGRNAEEARSTVRLSVEADYAAGQIEFAAGAIVKCIQRSSYHAY